VAIPEAVSVPLAETLRRSVARRYRHFTSAEQVVAQAVLRRPRLVIELPIQALAREIGVAPAVISRFSRTIGLSGFRALRVALAEELGAEGVAAAVVPQLDNHGAEPLWGAARASVLDDIAALQRNLDGIESGGDGGGGASTGCRQACRDGWLRNIRRGGEAARQHARFPWTGAPEPKSPQAIPPGPAILIRRTSSWPSRTGVALLARGLNCS